MNIHITNLSPQTTNEDLKQLFTPFGEVTSAEIAMDSFTDLPRGFAYVDMPDDEEGRAAIKALNQSTVSGNQVNVQEAKPLDVRKGSYKVGNGAVNVYRIRRK
jgi:RNA recognition motif-containing protein